MANKTREPVTWSDTYSIGIQLVDDQHKGLVNVVNELFSHSTGNEQEERAYFDEVIQQALDYVKNHFWTEEKCMLATQYPEYAEHKKVHDEFTFTVIKTVNEFKTGRALVLEKFADFLKEWVLNHIAVMDKQFGLYCTKTGNVKPDGEMSAALGDIVQSLTIKAV